MYAETVINLNVQGTYHYEIPAELAGRLQIGHLVEVEFGRGKAQGVILRFDRRSPVEFTKPVERLIDRKPVVDERGLALAAWLSERYLAPLSACVGLFIPPGLSRRGDVLVSPVIDPTAMEAATDTQTRLLKLLARRGPLRGRQIAYSLPRRDWRGAVSQLVERGLLLREPVLDPPAVRPKQVRLAELAVPPDRVEAIIAQHYDPAELSDRRRAAAIRRGAVLRLLASEGDALPVGEIYRQVEGSSLSDLRVLAEDDLLILRESEIWRDPLAGQTFMPDSPPRLTPNQAAAWAVIEARLEPGPEPPQPVLLHGVTGSGKTELYLRAVERVLAQGRCAIVMVPEIALTPQTVRRFGARFPGRMGLIHSHLSPGERYDTWRRARAGLIDLVIGPRSALFTPFASLGLIVLDECHDDSYKQSPPTQPPYYHAVPTAVELARQHGALAILGSATPNVATYHDAAPPDAAVPRPYTLLELPARIMGHRAAIEAQAIHYRISQPRYTHLPDDPEESVMIELPAVRVVDMRQELRAGNRSIFSRALVAALAGTLERGEQAILFLNRRGTATYVFCRNCGHVLACPRCETPLTWHTHAGGGTLVCHHCDYRSQHPQTCPNCGSNQIKHFGGGTERVEAEVRRRFPDARPLRWDRDTTGGKDAHDVLLRQFIDGAADVLIGTQMVAKGLDLPLVTLVGVISADTALYLPDYRSGERTFQLLTQVAGRAGRSPLGGEVILQTYAPDNYAIQAASQHDFHRFYEQELSYRLELGYPPYLRLARLLIQADSARQARQEAERLHHLLKDRIAAERLSQTSLIGPAPCYYARRDERYRWHVVVRAPDPGTLLAGLPPSRLVQVDVDPVSLL